METIGYAIFGIGFSFLIMWGGWTLGCWFTEGEMIRRQLEQERQAARNLVKPKSKTKRK